MNILYQYTTKIQHGEGCVQLGRLNYSQLVTPDDIVSFNVGLGQKKLDFQAKMAGSSLELVPRQKYSISDIAYIPDDNLFEPAQVQSKLYKQKRILLKSS
jgi:hypothetical protein